MYKLIVLRDHGLRVRFFEPQIYLMRIKHWIGVVINRFRISWKNFFSICLVLLSIVLSVVMIKVTSSRPLTALEGTLFQMVILGAGLWGSYRISQEAAARAVVPGARSAFRRVKSLYGSIERVLNVIEEYQSKTSVDTDRGLEVIQAIVFEQHVTQADALEDWRDIVPEDVEEIETRLEARRKELENLGR
jgi:hypothetical protein